MRETAGFPYRPGADAVFKDHAPAGEGGTHPDSIRAAADVTGLVRMAIRIADRYGTPRKVVADRLGVGDDTFDAWLCPSRRALLPVWALLRLMMPGGEPGGARRQPLPEPARLWLVEQVASLGGMVAFEPPESGAALAGGGADLLSECVGVVEITAAMGTLADAIGRARAVAGPGGPAVTDAERAEMLAAVDLVLREAAEVRALIAARPPHAQPPQAQPPQARQPGQTEAGL